MLATVAASLALAAPASAADRPPLLTKREARTFAAAAVMRAVAVYLQQAPGSVVVSAEVERARFCARWARHVVACDTSVAAFGPLPPRPPGSPPIALTPAFCKGKLRVRLSRTGEATVTTVGRPCLMPAQPTPTVTFDDSG
jgi:hypothetical protein